VEKCQVKTKQVHKEEDVVRLQFIDSESKNFKTKWL